ncbi:hypothetical protein HELRODRAFT_87257 [Helobdella robusta]|uniref:Tudor-knot domain-containing protein n=1 Tax=Helobdella robusta TaxID=6412 RepID=T1G6N5_HELRO|nr:hypothetical protein HELRODRAFT_87257 [Helobdella robusta]ESN94960.1 hypothetical protein HELRODRAFT_87257 [Helobdella robusta]
MSEGWEVGDRLEAQDYLNYWFVYTAKIIGSDAEKDLVLVHFEGWNSRYDEWVHVRSNRLRPLTTSSSPSPSNNKNNNNRSSSASGLSQHSLPVSLEKLGWWF